MANADSTRQLREDNLLLRKDLQQYRDRELMLLSRMEALEKKIGSPKKEPKPRRIDSREDMLQKRRVDRYTHKVSCSLIYFFLNSFEESMNETVHKYHK